MLRGMRRSPTIVWVYREKRWQKIVSLDVVPGDVISLSSNDSKEQSLVLNHHGKLTHSGMDQYTETSAENFVPCDLLLVRGACVVNEAMLTGVL